jgi:lauroyl/myristoyl acyltransferase
LPFPIRRLIERLEFQRFNRAAVPVDQELNIRISYGNLLSTFGDRYSREELRRMARRSRRVLRQTQFEIENPVYWTGFEMDGLAGLEAVLARGRGALVVSGHVGPYRFIPLELAHLGHHVEIVVDQRGLQRESGVKVHQADLLARFVDAEGRVGHWRANDLLRMGVINAEEPDIAVRMVRALREGHVVMVYLDGNTGAGPKKAEHLVRVPFLGTHILVRQGVGEIAKIAGAPVVPAFAWRRGVRRDLCTFAAPIEPAAGESREAFSNRVLAEFMAQFDARLTRDPGEWEEWHHFHRMRDAGGEAPPPPPEPVLVADDPAAAWAVDSYRAFAVTDGSTHLVFEPERGRFVKVSPLGIELVRALYRPQSLGDLRKRFGSHYDPETVTGEVKRLATRGWLERSA